MMAMINGLSGLGGSLRQLGPLAGPSPQCVLNEQPLRRVLAFTGRSIDDVVNCPIAKRQVIGFYKLHRQVERSCEITELERWWNGSGLSG